MVIIVKARSILVSILSPGYTALIPGGYRGHLPRLHQRRVSDRTSSVPFFIHIEKRETTRKRREIDRCADVKSGGGGREESELCACVHSVPLVHG